MRHTIRQTAAAALAACLLLALLLPAASARTVPAAASFSTAVPANRQSLVQLQGSDAESTALTYASTSTPAHGTLSNLNAATGYVVYTPTAGYTGSDSFTYTVTSGGETSAAGTVTISVTNAKTRVIDSVTDAGGNPRAGKVTFILTQTVTTPAGLTPVGSTLSASLNSSGQFDISVYPSRALNPAAYYQVWFEDSTNLKRELLGVFDIPAATAAVSLSGYKVTDTSLAARYTFASLAGLEALTAAVSSATLAQLVGQSRTTGKLQFWDGTNLSDSLVSQSGGTVTVAGNQVVSGSQTVAGAFSAGSISGITDSSLPSTMANKTLSNPMISGGSATGMTLNGPTFSGSISGATLSAPTITGGTATGTTLNSPTINSPTMSGPLSASSVNASGTVTSAGGFVGPGGGITGITSAGVGGSSSTGSLSLIANSGGATPGAVIDFFPNGGGGGVKARLNNDGTFDTIGGRPRSTKAGLPGAGNKGREYVVTDSIRGTWVDTGDLWAPKTGVANVLDFGASGSSQTATCSITSGQATLTCTTAADFRDGQGIYVPGAGAAGAPLVTTISSGGGTTSLTLATTASTTAASVTAQHDESAAVQAAIQAVYDEGGGVVYFPSTGVGGRYRVNGPLDATHHSILTLPQAPAGQAPRTIKLLGDVNERTSGNAPQYRGAVLDAYERASLSPGGLSSYASVISGKIYTSTSSLSNFNYVFFEAENLHVRLAPNSYIGGIQMHNVIGARLRNVQVTNGQEAGASTITEPTHPENIGLLLPGHNNHAQVSLQGVSMWGMYTGIIASEHAHFIGDNYASYGKVCLEFEQGGHLNWGKMGCEIVTTHIKRTGGGLTILDLTLTAESDRSSGTWRQSTYEVDDPSSILYGTLRTEITQPGISGFVSARRNGAISLEIKNLRTGRIENSLSVGGTSSYASTNGTVIGIHDNNTTGANTIQGYPAGGKYEFFLSANAILSDGVWTRFDTASPSWNMFMSNSADKFAVRRTAAGSGTISWPTEFFSINSSGNSTFSGSVTSAGVTSTGVIRAQTITTFTDGATTPAVSAGNIFKASNTGATTITNFTSPGGGQVIRVICTNGNTTIQNNANVKLAGAANFTCTADDVLTLLWDGSSWRETGRAVN